MQKSLGTLLCAATMLSCGGAESAGEGDTMEPLPTTGSIERTTFPSRIISTSLR